MIISEKERHLFSEYFGVPVSGRERRSAIFSDSAEASASNVLTARRAELYMPLLFELMMPYIPGKYPLARLSMLTVPEHERINALMKAAEALENDSKTASLCDRYPVLSRFDGTVCGGMEKLLDEISLLVFEKHDEISSAFFDGRDFGKITKISLPGTHGVGSRPGGRMTLLLECECGSFLFKPRVCKAERLYERLLDSCFPEISKVPKTVSGEEASFTEFIETGPLLSKEDAYDYYYRLGMQTAVFFAFFSTDMHAGNFIPFGSVPVPCDLECLFPTFLLKFSGINPGIDDLTLLKNALLDGSSGSPLYVSPKNERYYSSLPMLDGRPITALFGKERFMSGFSEAFCRILEIKDEWSRMIKENTDVPFRFKLRPGRSYAAIIRGMFMPSNLSSEKARDEWLDRACGDTKALRDKRLSRLEREDLENLDLPEFYVLSGESSARHYGGETVMENSFIPPSDFAVNRLHGLTEETLKTASAGLSVFFDQLEKKAEREKERGDVKE